MLIEETVHITFGETNQKMQDKPENSADDEETGRWQKLTETAAEQNEELDTAELDTAEKETDLIDHQINLPIEWRVPRNLSLDNVIVQIHKRFLNQKFTKSTVWTHGICVTDWA